MGNIRPMLVAQVAGILMISGVAFAHHGTANYETTKSISVTGAVTDFNFTNPHVEVFLDAKDTSGKITKWQGELTSPNHLARSGWHKDTLKPGDVITISGFPTKSGTPEIWIQKIVLADGTILDTSGGN